MNIQKQINLEAYKSVAEYIFTSNLYEIWKYITIDGDGTIKAWIRKPTYRARTKKWTNTHVCQVILQGDCKKDKIKESRECIWYRGEQDFKHVRHEGFDNYPKLATALMHILNQRWKYITFDFQGYIIAFTSQPEQNFDGKTWVPAYHKSEEEGEWKVLSMPRNISPNLIWQISCFDRFIFFTKQQVVPVQPER